MGAATSNDRSFRPLVHHCGLTSQEPASVMGQLILSEKGCFMYRPSTVLFLLAIGLTSARAQTPPARPARPTPPTRDAHTPGYVMAKAPRFGRGRITRYPELGPDFLFSATRLARSRLGGSVRVISPNA